MNLFNVLKDFKNEKISKNELAESKEFLEFATKNGFSIFDLAFDKSKMNLAINEYKKIKEIDVNEV